MSSFAGVQGPQLICVDGTVWFVGEMGIHMQSL
jgi:hypothetical protein